MLIPNCFTKSGEPKYEIQIRSFFVSTKTGKKIWDEPPSGAEAIEYANEEVRRMAEAQKQDLECVTVPNGNGDKKEKKKFGARVMSKLKGGSFRRKSGVSKNGANNNAIQVKKNSQMSDFLQGSSLFSPEFHHHNNPDSDFEIALAKSANEESNSIRTQQKRKEEEELAIAMAMSLSVKGV